jgi:hypothetical protein
MVTAERQFVTEIFRTSGLRPDTPPDPADHLRAAMALGRFQKQSFHQSAILKKSNNWPYPQMRQSEAKYLICQQ